MNQLLYDETDTRSYLAEMSRTQLGTQNLAL